MADQIKPIFNYLDYKTYVLERFSSMPRKGRGELGKIAKDLRMHPTRVSHIFRGDMNLTLEQACGVSHYLGLSSVESEYFLLLVNLARAGSVDLQKMLKEQAEKIRERAKSLSYRVPRDMVLSEEQKAMFYSGWHFSAIRLLTSIEGFQTVDALAEALQLPREKVRNTVDFLLSTGLCIEKNGLLFMGPKTTHLEETSPLMARHHSNWRLKAMSRHENIRPHELAYTCTVSLTKEDQIKLREMLMEVIEKFLKKVTASDPAEKLACLTIDWLDVI